ncbi:MAG: class I SAM-dependent methyltransferase [Chloroflexi bacterium]|nr:class I SAM-dependent methyltransferase [Chloroflexota bacterium]
MSRGEQNFVKLPRFGASLYDRLTHIRAVETQVKEIAQDLCARVKQGRLLDVGTGPGRVLLEIHKRNPQLELCGLDIADAMVQLAKQNLAGIDVDLRQGNIRRTSYADDAFDLVTCTGSFYLWDYPEECLDEIHRILKKDRSAYLFETHRDYDGDEFRRAMRANLRQENLLQRMLTPIFLEKQLGMTYRTAEVAEIIKRTKFADSFTLEEITLASMPVWLRITLTKK